MKLVVFSRCRVIGPVVMSCIPAGRPDGGAAGCVTDCASGSAAAETSLISVSGAGVVVMNSSFSGRVLHVHTRRKNSHHIFSNVWHPTNIKFAQSRQSSQRPDAGARQEHASRERHLFKRVHRAEYLRSTIGDSVVARKIFLETWQSRNV